jgi:MFS family permease
MVLWRRNLIFCWFGAFVTGIGMSQIAPIMPLYIRQLGIENANLDVELTGLAFGITFVVSAIFSPIWGKAADKFGRKPMLLRASLGMAIVIAAMGFSPNVYVLISLRALQGMITGYTMACTTLIATQTDKEHAGWALGVLSTAGVSGSLLGPILGGIVAQYWGYQSVFFITGGLMMLSFITTVIFIKEEFVPSKNKILTMRQTWDLLPEKKLFLVLFVTNLMVTLALFTIEPILTVYVSHLTDSGRNLALISGLVFSSAGLAGIISAPILGKLSDIKGPQRVLVVLLFIAALVCIPQAFVHDPWQLLALRFLLGLFAAGLTPGINSILKSLTPPSITGRVFGFIISATYLGVFFGSVLGGQIASNLGIRYVFFLTSFFLFINLFLVNRFVANNHELQSIYSAQRRRQNDKVSAFREATWKLKGLPSERGETGTRM